MNNLTAQYLIVLTYKRKILLKRQEMLTSANKNTWSFIEDMNGDMGITLPVATPLSNNFYHAGLTDKNVNQIKRADGKELQFFAIKEVEELLLSQTSKLLFMKFKTTIESSFSD